MGRRVPLSTSSRPSLRGLPRPGTYGVYVAGPLLGDALVALTARAAPAVFPVTAKLFHDARYHSVFRTAIATPGHGERDRDEFVRGTRRFRAPSSPEPG